MKRRAMAGGKSLFLWSADGRGANRFLFCFLLGVVVGTVMTNLLGQDIGKQAGYFGNSFTYGMKMTGEQRFELFASVCRQRGLEAGFAWLAGLTVFAVPCFCILSGFYGVTAGVLLSVTTFQKGLMGIPYFLASVMPHYLVYIPVWCILAIWAGQPSRKIRILPLAGLALLIFAGALLEAYVNPFLLNVLIS